MKQTVGRNTALSILLFLKAHVPSACRQFDLPIHYKLAYGDVNMFPCRIHRSLRCDDMGSSETDGLIFLPNKLKNSDGYICHRRNLYMYIIYLYEYV